MDTQDGETQIGSTGDNGGLEPKLSALTRPGRAVTRKDSNTGGLVNRGDDPYPVGMKAEAVAIVYETGNLSEAARQMKGRYPNRHPSRQLITRWFKQTDPEAFAALSTERKEAFQSGVIELADKARARLFDALDDMKPEQVAIPAGIAMDKGLRLLEIEQRHGGAIVHTAGPILIVTNAQAPVLEASPLDEETIEGEATDVDR